MAITTESSLEHADQTANPVVKLGNDELQGKVVIAHFDFTQGVAIGDDGSFINFINLPGGKIRILKFEFATSAFGTARVLKIGNTAALALDGKTAIAADDDAFAVALDLSSAVDISDLSDTVIETFDGFTVQGTVTGDTIPAGATLKGYIAYTRHAI